MCYETLTPREKQVLDILFSGSTMESSLRMYDAIGRHLGISGRTVKALIRTAGWRYGIDSDQFHLSTQLVYLRAKELGMIQ